MPTPQQVLDAEAEADRLIGSLTGAPPEGDDPTTGEGQPGDDDTRVATGDGHEGGEPATGDEPPTPQAGEGDEPAPAPSGGDEAGKLREQIAELQAQLTKLQAAHDTLRGKTYAEVPRTLAENKSLREQVAALKAEVDSLRGGATAPSGRVTGKAADILASLKESVNDDVADRIQQLVEVMAEEAISKRIKPVETSVETLRASEVESRQNQYLRVLTEKVPDWRSIANDPEYSTFLSQADDFSGKTLYDLASDALDSLDAERMARFFIRFKDSKKPAESQPAGQAGAKPAGKEALLTPKGNTKTGQREVNAGEKPDYITTKQLEQFAKDRKKMDPDDEAKMEARIDRAIQKGWIVPV